MNASTEPSLCPVCAAGQELLDAEEAHRRAPTLVNTSRLARARRAVEAAIAKCEGAIDGEDSP